MNIQSLVENILHPPILFFFLGLIATVLKSDLEIPPAIGKFLGLYLLFNIGIKGGEELYHSGIDFQILKIIVVCILFSFFIPVLSFQILKLKLDIYNAGAVAATYGSISAVTFATAISFLDSAHIKFSGYMVAGMALMESPAIIAGILIIRYAASKSSLQEKYEEDGMEANLTIGKTIHEALFNGSVLLLLGSMLIGYVTGQIGEEELKPFVGDIFKGMLCFYMLDMGIVAGGRMNALKNSGVFLSLFALLYPIIGAILGILVAAILGIGKGDALLFTILLSSASYIAVPAAMRLAVPQANMSILLPMALGITFTFNVTMGIPIYFSVINYFWK
jgi:hypothetical protein